MSTKEKRIKRLLSCPSDYSFDELDILLKSFGYELNNKGKTSGSRVCYINKSKPGATIMIHKPHNPPYVKKYAIRQVIEALKGQGDIDE